MTNRKIAVLVLLALTIAGRPALAAPLLADAALACAQTPADSAGDMANSQITPDDPNVGTVNCAKLCQAWVRACKGVVGTMKGCWLSAVGKIAGVRNATCGTLPKDAQGPCKEAVKTEKDAAKDFLKTNVDTAKIFCDGTGLANCLLNCS